MQRLYQSLSDESSCLLLLEQEHWIKTVKKRDLIRRELGVLWGFITASDTFHITDESKHLSAFNMWGTQKKNDPVSYTQPCKLKISLSLSPVLESWLDHSGELEPPDPLSRLPQLKQRIRRLLRDLCTVRRLSVWRWHFWLPKLWPLALRVTASKRRLTDEASRRGRHFESGGHSRRTAPPLVDRRCAATRRGWRHFFINSPLKAPEHFPNHLQQDSIRCPTTWWRQVWLLIDWFELVFFDKLPSSMWSGHSVCLFECLGNIRDWTDRKLSTEC